MQRRIANASLSRRSISPAISSNYAGRRVLPVRTARVNVALRTQRFSFTTDLTETDRQARMPACHPSGHPKEQTTH